jgi:hypothetical protein
MNPEPKPVRVATADLAAFEEVSAGSTVRNVLRLQAASDY